MCEVPVLTMGFKSVNRPNRPDCTHIAYITLLKRSQFDMEKSFHNLNIDVLKELCSMESKEHLNMAWACDIGVHWINLLVWLNRNSLVYYA